MVSQWHLSPHQPSFVTDRGNEMTFEKTRNQDLGRPNLEEFQSQEKLPVAIVLDNVRSMNNVGSVFRTADAFAADQIVLTGITGKPPHREINKTALGATESVRWQKRPSARD